MKKISFIIVLVCLSFFCSCGNNEKKQMEGILLQCLKSPSSYKFISFKIAKTETLADEVSDRLELYGTLVNWDEEKIEWRQKDVENAKRDIQFYKKRGRNVEFYNNELKRYEKELEDAKTKYNRDKSIVDYLNSVDTTDNKITFYTCELKYEAKNILGVSLVDVCSGRFNSDGKLVAIKIQDEGEDWKLFGNWFSIPNYYEIIK